VALRAQKMTEKIMVYFTAVGLQYLSQQTPSTLQLLSITISRN